MEGSEFSPGDDVYIELRITHEGVAASLFVDTDTPAAPILVDEAWYSWSELVEGDEEAWSAFQDITIANKEVTLG
jgi:hypothetical protein